jgi:2C-methyl-D-erythritol 2,4-cyclodiphosphate synthase
MRIGIGHDIHQLVPGRALTLGGVAVPAEGRGEAASATVAVLLREG